MKEGRRSGAIQLQGLLPVLADGDALVWAVLAEDGVGLAPDQHAMHLPDRCERKRVRKTPEPARALREEEDETVLRDDEDETLLRDEEDAT